MATFDVGHPEFRFLLGEMAVKSLGLETLGNHALLLDGLQDLPWSRIHLQQLIDLC